MATIRSSALVRTECNRIGFERIRPGMSGNQLVNAAAFRQYAALLLSTGFHDLNPEI